MFRKLTLITAMLAALAGAPMTQAQSLHEGGGPEALFEKLDLSDTQWLQVHKLMKAHRHDAKPLHERERALHERLATLDTTSTDYATKLRQLQDDAAQVARDRVQSFATLKGQVDAVLTPAQRSKLSELAHARHDHGPRGHD